MNILYIYGWNSSSESDTYKYLKKNLSSHNIYCYNYNQLNINESIEFFDKKIINNNINMIIASSFGAFVAVNINHSVLRILINPCLKPTKEIPKLETIIDLKLIKDCQFYETKMQKFICSENALFTTAYFSDNDELFNYKDEYLNLGFWKYKILKNEKHRVSEKALNTIILEQILQEEV